MPLSSMVVVPGHLSLRVNRRGQQVVRIALARPVGRARAGTGLAGAQSHSELR